MSLATVKASTSVQFSVSAQSFTVPIPGTPVDGDPIGVWVTTFSANTDFILPTGWTLGVLSNLGTGTHYFIHKKYSASDGSSLFLTWGNGGFSKGSAACIVFDQDTYSDIGAPGTVQVRSAASNINVAPAAGSAAAPNLVCSADKTTGQTSITPEGSLTTLVSQLPDSTYAGSVYVGTYEDSTGTADKTITYGLTANANGLAYQVPLVLATTTPPAVTETHQKVIDVDATVVTSGTGTVVSISQDSGPAAQTIAGPFDDHFFITPPASWTDPMVFTITAVDDTGSGTATVTLDPSILAAGDNTLVSDGTAWINPT